MDTILLGLKQTGGFLGTGFRMWGKRRESLTQFGPGTVQEMAGSPDWTKFILDRPMAGIPGTTFNYSDGNPQLLSAILTKLTRFSPLRPVAQGPKQSIPNFTARQSSIPSTLPTFDGSVTITHVPFGPSNICS
jgi:hypothetical protein